MADCCATPAGLIGLEEARRLILQSLAPVQSSSEWVALPQALQRVLANDEPASLDLPPFANSAMDGYALRHQDSGQTLRVVGTAWAGRPFMGMVREGECVRIFTGAEVPGGTDAVVMQEDTECVGDQVRLSRTVRAGQNIRPAGDEIRQGECLLPQGRLLQAADIALLASAGAGSVAVTRKLRVAFFSTGDELKPVGEPLGWGQIHDSNRYLLHSLLLSPAIYALDMGIVPDDPQTLKQTLANAAQWADVILSTGGVSVGEADFVTSTLAELGQVGFWKVAIKPGKPFAFGRVANAWFFGLPGNPVAVFVTFRQLVLPALRRLQGAEIRLPLRLPAVCQSRLKKSPGRLEFQRGILSADADGRLAVSGVAGQGSHQLLGVCRANGFIVLPAESTGVQPGETVLVEPFAQDL